MMNTNAAVIFDVDDTLCDTAATRDGVQRPIQEQSARWIAAAPRVTTCEEAMLYAASGVKIVLMTARHESLIDATIAQVESFGIPVHAIFTRAQGDNRVDWKVKTDLLACMIADGLDPIAAYDDKVRNVQVFAEAGIPAFVA